MINLSSAFNLTSAPGRVAVGCSLLVWSVMISPMAAAQDEAANRKQRMMEKGLEYETAWELYQALKEEAGGGERLTWSNLPDWSGVYSRTRGAFFFDPDQETAEKLPASLKLTPEYHARLMERLDKIINQGIEFDPISTCASPGHPRWLDLPGLRDHTVTPDQTTMIASAYNMVRRIYTDGRGHMPEEERYPLYLGDSIGFWDGHKLVVHTNQLRAHYYERKQPEYTEQVETVEVWEKVDDRLEADVWVYDPPVLLEPWYTRQSYTKLVDPEKLARIRHYDCRGNPNSEVIMTEDGGSQFTDFTFD